jgi:hypothetical protein
MVKISAHVQPVMGQDYVPMALKNIHVSHVEATGIAIMGV